MEMLRDMFFIRADKNLNRSIKMKGANGELFDFFIDTDFNKYKYATQIGEVAKRPRKITSKYINDVDIENGDTVYFHHFVVDSSNAVDINGEELFRCDYSQIWAKIVDGELKPIEDWIFIEPILESEEDIIRNGIQIKPNREYIKNQGIVYASSLYCKQNGIKDGQKVHFVNDADYDIKIGDKTLYRMKLGSIIAIEDAGELIPLNNKILVKDVTKDEVTSLNLIILNSKTKKQKEGVVIKKGSGIVGVDIDDRVSYFHGLSSKIVFNNQEYATLSLEQLNFIYV